MNSGIFGGLVPQNQPEPPYEAPRKSQPNRPSGPNLFQGLGMGNLVQNIIDESKERLDRMYQYPASYK